MIHITTQGETAYSVAQKYGISLQRLLFDNQINNPNKLVPGQALVVLIPEIIHTVKSGESLYSIAEFYGVSVLSIKRNNPFINTDENIQTGESIVIKYQGNKIGNLTINGYAYPFIQKNTLSETLLYLSELSVFSYGFTITGELIPIYDYYLISQAKKFGVSPILTLTPLGEDGKFNNNLVSVLCNNREVRDNLIQNLLKTVKDRGYSGVNVDFEYVKENDKYNFVEFVGNLTKVLNQNGFKTSVALAPKASSDQEGLIYEGIDYKLLGENANSVLLMTYEWGYTYGPPMAVAPLNKVKEVLDYGVTQIPKEKIDMGIPNYGYDWTLPFVRGESEAKIIGNPEAVEIALKNGAEIKFDNTAMSPYFEYSKDGKEHIVWFEDARSILAKLETAVQYGLRGVGYWNLMRYFRQNWMILNNILYIKQT